MQTFEIINRLGIFFAAFPKKTSKTFGTFANNT